MTSPSPVLKHAFPASSLLRHFVSRWRYLAAVLTIYAAACLQSRAQIPHRLNYQGRVAVGAQNFNGNGQFKFALINDAATTAYWKNSGPAGSNLTPPSGVTIPVQNGHYSVQLGDTTLANMQALPPGVFTANSDVKLRVWFNDGVNGFQALVPDQKLAAVGYAIMASDVRDGAVTSAKVADGAIVAAKVADGTLTAAKLANGAITAPKLAAGAARDNLAASGLSAVPSGGSVFSDRYMDSRLLNAGYTLTGTVEGGSQNAWVQLPNAPQKRHSHTFTASESWLTVFGGFEEPASGGPAVISNTGALYDLNTQIWTPTPTLNAPSARSRHTAANIDGRLYIWGGSGAASYIADGGVFAAGTNSWTAIPASPVLTARRDHSMVSTNTEMICFGGETGVGTYTATGARYLAATGVWTALPSASAPSARARHTAVIVNNKMVIWGGQNAGGVLATGASYDLTTNTWTALSTTGAPAARTAHCVQRGFVPGAGERMFIWGGEDQAGNPVAGGAIYDAVANTWSAMNATGAPAARTGATFSFAGGNFLYWGGRNGATYFGGRGGVFNYFNSDWSTTSPSATPAARSLHAACTPYNNRVYLMGGTNGTLVYDHLHVWIPNRVLYIYERL